MDPDQTLNESKMHDVSVEMLDDQIVKIAENFEEPNRKIEVVDDLICYHYVTEWVSHERTYGNGVELVNDPNNRFMVSYNKIFHYGQFIWI